MATYKVLQDIEAEDKLIGPLTLRQFIYAAIGAIFLYLSYILASKGAAFMLVLFLPVVAVSAFFAFPWMRDQPTEVWALAKIRYLLKPRKRVWSQDGLKELVTITVPKKTAANYTNGLSQSEVRSRLHALADTLDSRGWVVKSTNISLSNQLSFSATDADSDRLVAPIVKPQQAQDTDIRASDDILDEQNNSVAQRLKGLVDRSAQTRRAQLVDNLQNAQAPKPVNNYWFLNQPSSASKTPSNMVTFNTQVIEPGTNGDAPVVAAAPVSRNDEATIMAELNARKEAGSTSINGHMRNILPISAQQQTFSGASQSLQGQPADDAQTAPLNPISTSVSAPVTPTPQTAILSLANNNDLNVATIAREAGRNKSQEEGEVVVKLH